MKHQVIVAAVLLSGCAGPATAVESAAFAGAE